MSKINKNTPEVEIDDMLGQYTDGYTIDPEQAPEPTQPEDTKKRKGRPKKEVIPDNAIITGAVLVLLIDLFIPNVIAFLNNRFDKKNKIKATTLMLSKEQRVELEPISDLAAKQMMLQASPVTLFFVSLIGIYGINFMMLKNSKNG